MKKIQAKITGFARKTEAMGANIIPMILNKPISTYVDRETGEVTPSNILFLPMNVLVAKLEALGKSVDAQTFAYLVGCEVEVEVVAIKEASEEAPFMLKAKYSDKEYPITVPGLYDVNSKISLSDRAMDKLPASESFTSMFEGIFAAPTVKTPVKGNEEIVVEPDEDFVEQAEEAAEETEETAE